MSSTAPMGLGSNNNNIYQALICRALKTATHPHTVYITCHYGRVCRRCVKIYKMKFIHKNTFKNQIIKLGRNYIKGKTTFSAEFTFSL